MDKIDGFLEVGTNDNGEVIINLGEDKTGHVCFSPEQARNLASILCKHATIAEPESRQPAVEPLADEAAMILTQERLPSVCVGFSYAIAVEIQKAILKDRASRRQVASCPPEQQADSRPCYLCGFAADKHPWELQPQGGWKRGRCPTEITTTFKEDGDS